MGLRTIRRRLQNDNLNERSARKVPCLSKKTRENQRDKMAGKPHCSQNERNLIRQLWRGGKTYRKKSKLIKLSENMITNALKPQKYTKNRDKPRKPT
ncbi:hypothetical protein QE152_g1273 [Popillia japonica]|uniref:Transposase n=1 Tax=Popillia japonica TaxID=7064 RepID=A0AAW1N7M2_POPJA